MLVVLAVLVLGAASGVGVDVGAGNAANTFQSKERPEG